ncbi:ATP-dependent transcriptional regulator [Rhodobacterales bacterium 56_14_T64]|nr:ATP-dependent transcriptional regulator [Rhodobacterales bacterium 56_14_T64]
MIHRAVLVLAMLVAGCDAVPLEQPPTRARIADSSLPPIKDFASAHPVTPQRSNADMARDFLDLHFMLEGGSTLPVFTRFEGPITLRVTGRPTSSFNADLSKLLSRLQREAGINIRRIDDGSAHITIQSVSRAEIRRALPKAACFVVPNVSSLAEFRRNKRNPSTNWSQLRQRNRLAIFLPNDVSPQEVRDCLHEELAQAIGPLNDLYRLPDSVFNDDNVHTVLTGFDMLILRATYAPELTTGMSRAEVAARLPAILSRNNPRGDSLPSAPLQETSRDWIKSVEAALGPDTNGEARKRAANQAVATAQRLAWRDHRRAFSHYILGRMIQASDPTLAQKHFQTSMHFLGQSSNTVLHRAHIAARMAAYEIARGNGPAALTLVQPSITTAAQFENAALLSTLMLLQAEALELTGDFEAARAVRLDSLGWARYGFGSDWAVRAKMSEIAALGPNT